MPERKGEPPSELERERGAFGWDAIMAMGEMERIEQLSPEQVHAELRELGIDPAECSAAKALARARVRRDVLRKVEPGPWSQRRIAMGGKDWPVGERRRHWLAMAESIERETYAQIVAVPVEEFVRRNAGPGAEPILREVWEHANRRLAELRGAAVDKKPEEPPKPD